VSEGKKKELARRGRAFSRVEKASFTAQDEKEVGGDSGVEREKGKRAMNELLIAEEQ